MRKTSFATLGILALLAAASAFAQQRMTFDIPFGFQAGTNIMPAGRYQVTQLSPGSGLTGIACYARKVDVRVLTTPGGSGNERTKGVLVFNKYGDAYFLSSVRPPGSSVGRVLPTSETESELVRRASLTRTTKILLAQR
jgi:hypothetical protein